MSYYTNLQIHEDFLPEIGYPKSYQPPPIIIEGQDSSNTVKLCAEHLEITDFHIKNLSSGKYITYIHNPADYEVVKEDLKTVDTTFFTYIPKENKLQSYLLKGVNVNFTPEEIHEELNKLETSEMQFVRVQRFSTKLSRSNNKVLPILLVQLSPDSQPARLHSIKFVAYQAVHWEKLEKTETTQCRRCQRLGHTAPNCNMNFRCVKCKDNHPPGQCSVPKGEKIEKEIVHYDTSAMKRFLTSVSLQHVPKASDVITLVKKTFLRTSIVRNFISRGVKMRISEREACVK